nr:HNH endonuclease signature motif containing protein [Pseudonocardia oceani]
MADTLVERLTGQTHAGDVNVEIQVVVPVEALVGAGSPLPAHLPGHGPVPISLLTSGGGRRTWRRLVTRDGVVIGGDSRSRLFTGRLASLVRASDGDRCREPYCDAPIRHIDHIRRWADRGPTEFDNGRGLCVFHNQVRETRGWRAEMTPEGIVTTTPTGRRYTSDIRSGSGGGTTAAPGRTPKDIDLWRTVERGVAVRI